MASVQPESFPESIVSYVPFLARDRRYDTERPYATDFPVDDIDGADVTNHVMEIVPVTFHNARCLKEPLSLDSNGVCFIKATTSLRAGEATIERTPAMEQYAREVIAVLRDRFPQYTEIQCMDFQVRKRSPTFPHGHKQIKVDHAQPATVPHTDFSLRGAYLRMKEIFPEQEALYRQRQFDLINVWRVLEGPNDDWPLAVCDYSTIDVEHDTTVNDALHLTRVGENWLLHHSDAHRWYYLSGMEEDDLIVFRNVDSSGELSRCFHVAFNNPSAQGSLRHSVEIRLVAFREEQMA